LFKSEENDFVPKSSMIYSRKKAFLVTFLVGEFTESRKKVTRSTRRCSSLTAFRSFKVFEQRLRYIEQPCVTVFETKTRATSQNDPIPPKQKLVHPVLLFTL
jgi:hypothetical protein